jgi:predicted site-specific integrase-resolvase
MVKNIEYASENGKEFLSRKELATKLGVNPSTIHNWVVQGRIKRFQLGGRVWYNWKQIVESFTELK